MAAEFGTGEVGAQATLTAYLIGTCIGFAVYGPLSDRLGRRRMLAISGALFVAASIACAYSESLAALTAARGAQGFGSVAGIITARATIRDAYPPAQMSRYISLLSATMAVAPAMSPVLGAVLLTFMDWRLTFLAAALVAAIAIVLALFVMPPRKHATSGADIRNGLRDLLASPTYRSCLVISSATSGAFMIMMAGSPFVLMDTYGLSELAYAISIAIVLLSFALVAAAFRGHMAQRGARRTMGLGIGPMLTGATGMVLVSAFAPDVVLLLLTLILTVGAMGFIVPTSTAAMLEPLPTLAGTATSLAMLIATLFGALAVTAYGLLAAGSPAGFALSIAALCVATAFGWSRLPGQKPSRRTAAP